MDFDDFVCAKVICLPRKAKSCVTKASLSSSLSIYILQISLTQWMLITTLRELSFRWLYILPQLSHFDFSGFTDPNTFSFFSNMGLTLSLDLDLLITFSESSGLFVPHSPFKISAYDGFGSLHCCQWMPLHVGSGVLRIDTPHPFACRRWQTKWGDTFVVCCDP